jgi:mRNA interferase YafQ
MRKNADLLQLLVDVRRDGRSPRLFMRLPCALRGDWVGFRDLHIEPDWLLLYRIAGNEVQLARTGTHSDLFRD